MEERNNCVYKHTSPSGKVYIGITCTDTKTRWKNGNGYASQPAIARAIKKYGWEGFTHEVLATNLTRVEASELEQKYIALYNSIDPRFGYNCTSGGDEKYYVSKETRAKQSEAKKRFFAAHPEYLEKMRERVIASYADDTIKKKISDSVRKLWENPEHRAKMSVALSAAGKKHYQEHPERSLAAGRRSKERWKEPAYREKMKTACAGNRPTDDAIRKSAAVRMTPVVCVEENCVFDSLESAAEFAGVTKMCICDCCRARQETSGGFHWRYITDSESEWVRRREAYTGKNKSTLHKKVRCVETGVVYDTAYAAGVSVGRKCAPSIYECCRGRRKSAYGYHWEYAD